MKPQLTCTTVSHQDCTYVRFIDHELVTIQWFVRRDDGKIALLCQEVGKYLEEMFDSAEERHDSYTLKQLEDYEIQAQV